MKLTLLALSLLMALEARADRLVDLASLELSHVQQGWGVARTNQSVTGKPLSIGGERFASGVGTHATSWIWVDLGGGSERFEASVGADDAAKREKASVTFQVIADGKLLWDSGLMRGGEKAKTLSVNLHGVQLLLLRVGDGGNGADNDHANWADARFSVSGQLPKIVPSPREDAIVLTPPPPRAPRINGAKIFGVRPGSPFLFTVPVTGDRPITYSAEHLPAGLTMNPANGQISGNVAERGEYRVLFRAANSQGATSRELKIVCGDRLALTPHMGWNSWYIWENHVTDQIMRAAAEAMVTSGLRDHGYVYVNIDDCWAMKPGSKDEVFSGPPRDAAGKVNANQRFPDMKGLTDYIHARGLKAGIYTSPGPTTCAGHTGAYEHERQDVERFVEWGFDFLKHDWCSYGDIARSPSLSALQKPYRQISEILQRQPRDLILNLCQYGLGNVWEWGAEVGGQSWRTAGDLGGSFEGIAAALFRDGFDVYSRNELHRFAGPGGWNDPDYLLLGYLSNWKGQTVPTPLTPNEQYTQVSLWSLVAAPLIFSGDMTRLDAFTLGLLGNDEVIAVDQDPLGKPGRRITREGELEVWARELEDGSCAVGLFNRGDFALPVRATWASLGLSSPQRVRDLWRQHDVGEFETGYEAKVPRHGVVLVRLSNAIK